MRLVLVPDGPAREALVATLLAYRDALSMLDGTKGANVAALHGEVYEPIRAKTGLPARMVSLALRDHARRRLGMPVDDIPLDSKLFAIKGPGSISIATVRGRNFVRFSVEGYRGDWADFAEARLFFGPNAITVEIGIEDEVVLKRDVAMSTEGILVRLGRVIAGVVNSAVDAAETANPVAVAQQSIREIGKIAEEARDALGVAMAAGHRLKAKAADLDAEINDLDEKIRTGLAKGRDDLARAAIGVQIGLEAQREAIARAIAENLVEVSEAEATLRSVASAKADAMKRLEDAMRAEKAVHAAATPSQRNDQRLADALAAVERVTGVPAKPREGAAEVEELARLQREDAIEARLKAFRDEQR